MKIRMKFAKDGPLIYVGHLDILRFFQKCLRRAGVDVCYSGGFSPHEVLSFAAPLGLGLSSQGEYLDTEFHSLDMTKDELMRVMNEACKTPYIRILDIAVLDDDAKKAMAAVDAAEYTVGFDDTADKSAVDAVLKAVPDFLMLTDFEMKKKTKKGERVMNLRPLVYRMQGDGRTLHMRVSQGSRDNIKPELVVSALCQMTKTEINPFSLRIRRDEMLTLVQRPDGSYCYIPLIRCGRYW